MKKTLNVIYKIFCLIVSVFMAIMSVMVFVNAALRYTINSGVIVSEEISRYLFVWIIFCGAIVAAADGIHIKVDFIYKKFPLYIRRAITFVTSLLIVYCCYALFYGSVIQVKLNQNNYSPASGISISYVYLPIVIAGICMAVIYLARAWQALTRPDQEV